MSEGVYRLLVADDEYWSREKLRGIIDWQRCGIEFLEPAESGAEALERIEREKPDILISDVDMPGIDGMQLAARIKELCPDMVIFMVSGYDNFDYVKSTMKSGAINYLLKPVSKVELIAAISEAMELVEQKRRERSRSAAMSEELHRASSLLEDREYSRLLKAPAAPSGIPATGGAYGLALIMLHGDFEALDVKKRIRGRLEPGNVILFNNYYKPREFILMTGQPAARERAAAETLAAALDRLCPVTIALSGGAYYPGDIAQAYIKASAALDGRGFRRKTEVVNSLEQTNSQPVGSCVLSVEGASRLVSFVRAGNTRLALDEALVKTGFSRCNEEYIAYGGVRSMLSGLRAALGAQLAAGIAPGDRPELEGLMDAAVRSCDTLDAACVESAVRALIEGMARAVAGQNEASMPAIVRQAKAFIDEHYFEDITLGLLSEKFIVEGGYLSRCFKQETGENIVAYITSTRVEKAKALIVEGRVGLSKIAGLVGYDDYAYFSRVFRKLTGVSPKQFKEAAHGGQD